MEKQIIKLKLSLEGKLEKQTVNTKKGEATKQQFMCKLVGSDFDGVVLEQFGDEKVALLENLPIGSTFTALVNLKANEYKGRGYQSISAWQIEDVEGGEMSVKDAKVLLFNTVDKNKEAAAKIWKANEEWIMEDPTKAIEHLKELWNDSEEAKAAILETPDQLPTMTIPEDLPFGDEDEGDDAPF